MSSYLSNRGMTCLACQREEQQRQAPRNMAAREARGNLWWGQRRVAPKVRKRQNAASNGCCVARVCKE